MLNSNGNSRAFRVRLATLLATLIPLCVFVWLAEAVRNQRSLSWDVAILKLLHGRLPPWCDKTMAYVAQSGSIDAVVVLAVICVLVLKRQRRMRDALFVTLAIVGVVVVNLLVRTVVQRHQSDVWGTFAPTFEFGFPSSQAADSLAMVLVFSILYWRTRWRWEVLAPGILYALAVGVFRVHLGLHYPSDVVAGWALALAWVTAVSLVRLIPNGKSTKPAADR